MKQVTLLFVLIVFIIAGCRVNDDSTAKIGTLSYVEAHHPDDIFPSTIKNAEEAHLITQVHDGLLKLDPENYKLKPAIARRWGMNNKGDVIFIHLHDSVFFHKNDCFPDLRSRMLNASDVKYALEYTFWYKSLNSESIGLLENIRGGERFYENCSHNQFVPGKLEGIKVKDSLAIEIHLSQPNPGFIYNLANPDMVILPREGLKKYGDSCRIGCGPFVAEHFDAETDSVVMLRNEDYYVKDSTGRQLPYIERVTAYYEAIPARSLRMLRDGKVDFLLTLQQKHVSEFVEKNIGLFEAKKPALVLEQAKGMENTQLFMIRRSNIRNLQYSSLHFLYLDRVYIAKK